LKLARIARAILWLQHCRWDSRMNRWEQAYL
jgi:hypothetical protein